MYDEVIDPCHGVVAFFNPRRRYGFIRPLGQPKGSREGQVWFHIKDFYQVQPDSTPDLLVWQQATGTRLPAGLVNQAVVFEWSHDKKGRLKATRWTLQTNYDKALKNAERKPRRTMMRLG